MAVARTVFAGIAAVGRAVCTHRCLLSSTLAGMLLGGCASTEPAQPQRMPLTRVTKKLRLGETTQADVTAWLGEPLRKQHVRGLTVWTYEEEEWEQRSTYTDSRVDQERAVLRGGNVYGYSHLVSRKTVLTLIFDAHGVLRNRQLLRP